MDQQDIQDQMDRLVGQEQLDQRDRQGLKVREEIPDHKDQQDTPGLWDRLVPQGLKDRRDFRDQKETLDTLV